MRARSSAGGRLDGRRETGGRSTTAAQAQPRPHRPNPTPHEPNGGHTGTTHRRHRPYAGHTGSTRRRHRRYPGRTEVPTSVRLAERLCRPGGTAPGRARRHDRSGGRACPCRLAHLPWTPRTSQHHVAHLRGRRAPCEVRENHAGYATSVPSCPQAPGRTRPQHLSRTTSAHRTGRLRTRSPPGAEPAELVSRPHEHGAPGHRRSATAHLLRLPRTHCGGCAATKEGVRPSDSGPVTPALGLRPSDCGAPGLSGRGTSAVRSGHPGTRSGRAR